MNAEVEEYLLEDAEERRYLNKRRVATMRGCKVCGTLECSVEMDFHGSGLWLCEVCFNAVSLDADGNKNFLNVKVM